MSIPNMYTEQRCSPIVVIPWLKLAYPDGNFKEDGAPGHMMALTATQFLEEMMAVKALATIFARSQPASWSVLESKVQRSSMLNMTALKNSIRRTCASYQCRLEEVIVANGGCIELTGTPHPPLPKQPFSGLKIYQ